MNKIFFENLALESGTNDIDTVKKVYYGLIRKTIKDLGNGNSLVYPDFGEFYIKEQKAKRMRHVITGNMININSVSTVRFKPDYKLKNYVKEKNKS
jgi:nucleoid DNA-binding protein